MENTGPKLERDVGLYAIAFLAVPISVVAVYTQNRNLLILIYLIFGLTALLGGILAESKSRKYQDRFFLAIITAIGLSLLLSTSFSSSFLQGWDIHGEYAIFLQVSKSGKWQPTELLGYNSVLSVGILPAVLSELTGLDGISIFKAIFPLVYGAVVPLLYKFYRQILSPSGSFLSVFLVVAYHSFYIEYIALARQEVAELLFVLALLLLFSIRKHPRNSKLIAILMLTVGITVSHYSMAYLYLSLLILSFFLGWIFGKMSRLVDVYVLAIIGAIIMLWYGFLVVGGQDLANLVYLISTIFTANLLDLFSRPPVVSQALGFGVLPGLLHGVNRLTYYALNLALAIGFLVFGLKRDKDASQRRMMHTMTYGMLWLGAFVALPVFGFALGYTRMYHIALLLVSPCFVYGADWLGSKARTTFSAVTRFPRVARSNKHVLAAIILFSFLLFDSGWMWAVTMDAPTSPVLDGQRLRDRVPGAYFSYYTVSQDVAGAKWIRPQLSGNPLLCSDFGSGQYVLTSYGEIPRGSEDVSRSDFVWGCDLHSYVYLSVVNRLYGVAITYNGTMPISSFVLGLNEKNLIYCNGGTAIYGFD
jgi:uncharacterized membrane protein